MFTVIFFVALSCGTSATRAQEGVRTGKVICIDFLLQNADTACLPEIADVADDRKIIYNFCRFIAV